MKQTLMIAVALLVAVAFMTPAIAQDPGGKVGAAAGSGTAPVPAGPGAKIVPPTNVSADQSGTGGGSTPQAGVPSGKKASPKYAGAVTKVEGAMVTVKGKKDEKTFDVSKAKFTGYKDAAEIKAGDKVNVVYKKAGDKLMAEGFGKAAAEKAPVPAFGADQPPPGEGPGGAPKAGQPSGK
jgi:hypothetical protein